MRLTTFADPPDNAVRDIAAIVQSPILVSNLDALVDLLERLPPTDVETIDIVAHTSDTGVMQLGSSLLDPSIPEIGASLDRLGRALSRHGVGALRLLGCRSAGGDGGKAIVDIADRLGIRVFGSTTPLMPRHFDADGFRDDYAVLLTNDQLLGH